MIIKFVKWVIFLLVVSLLFLWVALARPAIGPFSTTVAGPISQENLSRHVRMLAIDLSPRNYQNINNLNASAEYIASEFKLLGLNPIDQIYTVGGVEYKNIIVELGPKEGRKLIVGAHYDTAGPYPGADDNASGVAGLLDLARVLGKEKLNRPVTLVAYTLEEPPFYASESMGSYVHEKSEKEAGNEIDLMISLEMIGYFSEEKNSQFSPLSILKLFYPTEGNFIAVIDRVFSSNARKVKIVMSAWVNIPVYSINAPSFMPGIDFSDHRSYWMHGYSAVMITDTSFYRNTMYHTEGDTINRLDFAKMASVVNGVFGFILNFDNRI